MDSWRANCGLKKPLTKSEAVYKAIRQSKQAYRCKWCKSWHTRKIKS